MSYPNSISLAPHSQTTNFVKGAIEDASSASCGMATLPGARVYLVAPLGCPALSLSGPAPTAASAASQVMASVGAAEDGASVVAVVAGAVSRGVGAASPAVGAGTGLGVSGGAAACPSGAGWVQDRA